MMNSLVEVDSAEGTAGLCLSVKSFGMPEHIADSAWIEHTPFALWLADAAKAQVIVELGTYFGLSYFTFCQAVAANGGLTKCYAVDTWAGDPHTGPYDDTIWRHVSGVNEKHYSAFSVLVRMTFDNALAEFQDRSIDLLHIDGTHFYEDVKHDFDAWVPKMSDCGIVLFHDTNVHTDNFGVARLWSELQVRFPAFEFMHGHGLGIIAVGTKIPAGLASLFAASKDPTATTQIRTSYARLGRAINDHYRLEMQKAVADARQLEIERQKLEIGRLSNVAERLMESDKFLTGLTDKLNEFENQQAHLINQLTEREGMVIALNQQLSEQGKYLTHARRNLSALESSTSWRLTAPLRTAASLLSASRAAPLELHPASQLERVQSTGQVVKWKMTGTDPYFLVAWSSRTYLPPSRYRLVLEIPECERLPPLSWLYVDSGQGFREFECIELRFKPSGKRRWSALFVLPKGAYALRFDPSATPGQLVLGRAWLRRVPKSVHYARLMSNLIGKRLNSPLQLVKGVMRAANTVATSGPRALARQLLSADEGAIGPEAAASPAAFRAARIKRTENFAYQPLISIITPVYNISPIWLERAIASVQAQTYKNWELCICDDASTNLETIAALEGLEQSVSRLRLVRSAKNGGIARATNQALLLAKGDYVAFLDNDDELAPHALESYVSVLNRDADIDVLYSDEDKINVDGKYEEPFLKPDWSPHFFREVMYVGHLLMARRTLVEEVGNLNPTFDGVQDFELMLRLSEQTSRIHHVRDILYHWRRIPGSIAFDIEAKPKLSQQQAAAVNAHLLRQGIRANATVNPKAAHRLVIKPEARSSFPRVSIVIPTKDAPQHISRCLQSIFDKTSYLNFEVVVVDNGSTDPAALAALDRYPVVRVPFHEQFNYSRANNLGVSKSTGEILIMLNNDTEVIDADWIEQMLFLLDDPNIGAVGPLLLYPNRKVQHAGVALGIRGTADHVLRGHAADGDGYFGSLICTREVSCVTFACAMIRKSDYVSVGGLQTLYGTHYQDVDFCLKLRESGKRILYTPRTLLVHHESATRGKGYDRMDRELLLDAWGETISKGDPFARWEPSARGIEE
jgi:O-antigen biosynthesis protein